MSIKAIILDVDGVIVGEKIGYNSPYPHPAVIQRLKQIHQSGIRVSLCTAKPYKSIEKIIKDAELNNLHITDGGSVVSDPLDGFILKKHVIDKQLARKAIEAFISESVYTEFYTVDDYFIQRNFQSDITEQHTHVLQSAPIVVPSLADTSKQHDIVKIISVARSEEDKKRLIKIFEPFQDSLTLSWGIHPIALPLQFGIITAKGVSKQQAATEIAEKYNIDKNEMLGVGDSTSDWQFIQNCGYRGAMANASEELKRLVQSHTDGQYVIGGHVDSNGVLDIFDAYELR